MPSGTRAIHKPWRAFKMRRIIFITAIFQFVSLPFFAQNGGQSRLDKFNAFIGEEKALVLQEAVDSFDQFLMDNYPNINKEDDRINLFLEQLVRYNKPDKSWIYNRVDNELLISSFESSGLRKEIWLYEYEEYESKNDFSKVLSPPEPVDTSSFPEVGELKVDLIEGELIPDRKNEQGRQMDVQQEREQRFKKRLVQNYEGDYIYGLMKYSPKDSFVFGYAQATHTIGTRVSPGILANGFLSNNPDYQNPLVKRLLVTEFYYLLIKWEMKK